MVSTVPDLTLPDLSVIRAALAEQLRTKLPSRNASPLPGPSVYERSSAGMNPPFIVIRPLAGRRAAMGGAAKRQYQFQIMLVLGRGLDDANWEARADDYLSTNGPLSIEAALVADKTLNGAVELLDVEQFDEYGEELMVNGVAYAGCRIVVNVWGKEPT